MSGYLEMAREVIQRLEADSGYEINELNEKSPCPRALVSGCNTSSLPFAIRLQCPEIVYGNHLQSDIYSDG